MTQAEFNKQIEDTYKYHYIKAVVARVVRLCIQHPCYAMIWYESQPKAIQEETKSKVL